MSGRAIPDPDDPNVQGNLSEILSKRLTIAGDLGPVPQPVGVLRSSEPSTNWASRSTRRLGGGAGPAWGRTIRGAARSTHRRPHGIHTAERRRLRGAGDQVNDLLETDPGGPQRHHDRVARVAAAIDLAIAARLCGVIGVCAVGSTRFRRQPAVRGLGSHPASRDRGRRRQVEPAGLIANAGHLRSRWERHRTRTPAAPIATTTAEVSSGSVGA